jgi:hypothetical protein
VHPRLGHLCSGSIPARLQLAALYAATGSLLPEPASRMTGAQIAMQLVRQCWGTKPLSPSELQQLASVAALGGHMAAALRLLVHKLQASAFQLNALHFPDGAPDHAAPPDCPEDWGTAYLLERKEWYLQSASNPRLLLQAGEEQRVLGQRRPVDGIPRPWKRLRQYQAIDVPECPVAAAFVPGMEDALRRLVEVAPSCDAVPKYPLEVSGSTPLEGEMHAELEDSWRVHHGLPSVAAVKPDAQDDILMAQVRTGVLVLSINVCLSSPLGCGNALNTEDAPAHACTHSNNWMRRTCTTSIGVNPESIVCQLISRHLVLL